MIKKIYFNDFANTKCHACHLATRASLHRRPYLLSLEAAVFDKVSNGTTQMFVQILQVGIIKGMLPVLNLHRLREDANGEQVALPFVRAIAADCYRRKLLREEVSLLRDSKCCCPWPWSMSYCLHACIAYCMQPCSLMHEGPAALNSVTFVSYVLCSSL
jgi:hypothetical protein